MKDLPYETPLQELSFLLHRLEDDIREARLTYRRRRIEQQRQILAASRSPNSPGLGIRRYWSRSKKTPSKTEEEQKQEAAGDDNGDGGSSSSSPTNKDDVSTPPRGQRATDPIASFIDMPSPDQTIEDLRRIAEIVIIGENVVTAAQKKQDKARQRGNADPPVAAAEDESSSGNDEGPNLDDHIQVFELFFERHALELIVNLLMGEAFDLAKHEKDDLGGKKSEEKDGIILSPDDTKLVPPLTIATQAIQSISLLIQNVSRATSLYVILSNNHINTLIGLPLNLYSSAERGRQVVTQKSATPLTFTSPPLTELTTHFVTFLKSLALRMNVQTLQFFLTYPSESHLGEGEAQPASSSYFSENSGNDALEDNDEAGPGRVTFMQPRIVQLDFPLYERALEFCAAHNDSFVRVTAMNICLNTLRLTTVVDPDDESSSDGMDSSERLPDGVLHSAQALPFRERFAIAQFACIPSRVEKLIAPICTKLAERWNNLEEQIREIDSYKSIGMAGSLDIRGVRTSEKVAKAKEKVRRERLIRVFKEKAADLQDELLLLDDVFRVGLTVLNEQLIEMMLATFVYPLLLQPLLVYYKRLTPSLEEARSSLSDHPFVGYDGDIKRVEEMVAPASGPAKTSLFTLASVFQFLTNRPLLRLLYTVLFHPLSPDSTSVPTVRSRLEVATLDYRGRQTIRLDRSFLDSELVPNERTTYEFGTDPKNRRRSKARPNTSDDDDDELSEACVFVLAPALAEVLEFRGQDFGLVARAKQNPYRHALLNCLRIPDEFVDVRQLSVCVCDSAFRVFEGSFVSEIMFGTDLKRFDDDMPQDERKLDSKYAHMDGDRGIGEGVGYESRQSLDKQKGEIGSDLVGDVVNAICCCVVFASRVEGSEEWEVGYNGIAAHALLCAVRHNARAMVVASKTMEQRWKRASSLVTARASSILSPMGGSSLVIRGSPSVNDPRYDEKLFNAILDMLLYGSPEHPEIVPALEDLLCTHDSDGVVDLDGYYTGIARQGTFNDLCGQVGTFLLTLSEEVSRSPELETLHLKRQGFCCLFKLDALLALLRDLSATGGIAIRDSKLASLVVSRDRSSQHMEMLNLDMSRQTYCVLSSSAVKTFFVVGTKNDLPKHGSRIDLSCCPIIPCVTEAPASVAPLFTVDGGVEAEGITWQSICLVVKNGALVFIQPGDEGVDGRVITACSLERVWVEQDSTPDPAFPARRLTVSHRWFDSHPPDLFLFDSLPEPEACGPFLRPKTWTSHMDIWIENEQTTEKAFSILSTHIFNAKSQRGQRVQEYLSFAIY